MQVQSLGQEDSLEEGMATHSNTFAWRISRTEEQSGPQSMGSPRVGHDRATNTQDIIYIYKPQAPWFVIILSF